MIVADGLLSIAGQGGFLKVFSFAAYLLRVKAMDTTAAPPPQQSFEECDFWVDLSNIKMGPEIGSGMFSKVYLGDYFGDLVAVKKQTRDSEKLEDYLFRELAVLKSAHHPNLMAYFGACNEVNPGGQSHALYIVTEFW